MHRLYIFESLEVKTPKYSSQFNSSPPTTGPSSDFNLDNQISILDLEILGRNYGGVGD